MRRITDISSAEWRWVILFSALLVSLTLLPYAIALFLDSSSTQWHFMGILPNPQDGATYLAKIAQGARGQWLFTLAHTPEESNGAAINLFYLALGHLANLIGFSNVLMFHLARVATTFVMYLSLYHLGATIWQKLTARRLFFALAGISSGFGWLFLAFVPAVQPVDLFVPEAFPLYASYANPHFPLAIALIALVAAVFIDVFRPGFHANPSIQNGGLVVVVMSVLQAILLPQAWLPLGVALFTYLIVQAIIVRGLPPRHEINWVLAYLVPGLPFLIYDVLVVNSDPLFKAWNEQNITLSGSPLNYLIGFGPLLILGIPGILRAIRRREQDGDRFMLVWLVTNTLLLYVPFNIQRRLVIGMIIPLTYFAVRSLQEFWLPRARPKRRPLWIGLIFVFVLPGSLFAIIIAMVGVLQPQAGLQNNQLLLLDYSDAIGWLKVNAPPGSVTLALPDVSLWIPSYTSSRVVYGHPFETVNAKTKLDEVLQWYSGQNCAELLTKYNVKYVLIGPNQAPPKEGVPSVDSPEKTACSASLGKRIDTFGAVTLYAARP